MVRIKREEREKAERASLPRAQKVKKEEAPKQELRRAPPKEERVDTPSSKIRPSGRMLWLVALAAVIFFLFALSFLFAKAEIKVNPKIKSLTLNENLTAEKDALGDALTFDVVIISGEDSKEVIANGQKDVAVKAQGVAVIYNTYSTATQNLDIDTRLEGSNGKMYKTLTKTTVPGMKDGKPGSVEVRIYASEAGSQYNSGPIDFKIFGFKGTAKYSKFYGRSKGSITGGMRGKAPALSPADEKALKEELTDSLKSKLSAQASVQTPEGYILFRDAVFLSIDGESWTPSQADPNKLMFSMRGTLYGVLFGEENLTQKIVKDNLKNYESSHVYIPHMAELTFSLAPSSITNLSTQSKLSFTLTGPVQVVSKVDTEKLAAELAGESKKNFNGILTQYPEIDSAELLLSPFWKTSFPSKSKKIHVTVNYPK